MLILDKRKAIERVMGLTVASAAAKPEARPRHARRTERREAKRARRAAATKARRVAAVEASEEEEESAAPA